MEAWANHGIGEHWVSHVLHHNVLTNTAIVGRGVLIDIWGFKKQSYDPFTTRPITLDEIRDCAKAQGVEFKYGDILIIRSGWVDAYLQKSHDEREALGKVVKYAHEFVGIEQAPEMLDFLHDNYFSAVASDTPGLESWPTDKDWNHHGILLPLWGLPIGEMWDLEKLAEVCRQRGQYEFFFASSPSNVRGMLILSALGDDDRKLTLLLFL